MIDSLCAGPVEEKMGPSSAMCIDSKKCIFMKPNYHSLEILSLCSWVSSVALRPVSAGFEFVRGAFASSKTEHTKSLCLAG